MVSAMLYCIMDGFFTTCATYATLANCRWDSTDQRSETFSVCQLKMGLIDLCKTGYEVRSLLLTLPCAAPE